MRQFIKRRLKRLFKKLAKIYPKIKPFTPLIIIIFILILFVTLNYSGFCWDEFKFFSKEEQIRRVFNGYNSRSTAYVEINGKGKKLQKANLYASFEEFIAKHPNCCRIRDRQVFPDDSSRFFALITGTYYSRVWFEFDDEFIDENGNIVVGKAKLYDVIGNCGVSVF